MRWLAMTQLRMLAPEVVEPLSFWPTSSQRRSGLIGVVWGMKFSRYSHAPCGASGPLRRLTKVPE